MANPVTEFEQYRNEILATLNGDDPIAVLRATLDEVDRVITRSSTDALTRQPAPGEWSPREVLSHLADSDMVLGVRLRMMVTQDRPVLVGYDQEAWTARFGALDCTAQETVSRWRALRIGNLLVAESLTPEEWERVGLHTERGEESVRLHLQLLAGHDRVHLDQIRRGLTLNLV